MSQASTMGRQERRGPHVSSALPGRSAAARARSLQRTRAAATELAAHRQRLLELAVEAELDPTDALLMRVDPAGHRAGLARIAEAALAVDRKGHRASKSPAPGSRPPATPPSSAASDLRLSASSSGFAPREGEDATAFTPSSTPPGRGEDMTQNQEEN